jgi:hypothetical protein
MAVSFRPVRVSNRYHGYDESSGLDPRMGR